MRWARGRRGAAQAALALVLVVRCGLAAPARSQGAARELEAAPKNLASLDLPPRGDAGSSSSTRLRPQQSVRQHDSARPGGQQHYLRGSGGGGASGAARALQAAAAPISPGAPLGCPESYSVAAFGASGDGATDDSGALAAADASLAALYLRLVPGNVSASYRVASDLTLTKPLIVPCGSR